MSRERKPAEICASPRLLGVLPDESSDTETAFSLASRSGLPLLEPPICARSLPPGDLLIEIHDGVAGLQMTGSKAPGFVPVTFMSARLAHRRRAGHNELLGKAVGWRQDRHPRIADTTAGFGVDSFLLADLGCDVVCCERNSVMSALLDHALNAASDTQSGWLVSVASRIRLHSGDARLLSADQLKEIDVLYIDPMFPAERRAQPGKEMQLLQALLRIDDSEQSGGDGLFNWALSTSVPRVVVKRPRRELPLCGRDPSHQLQGRSVRFDVYQLR
ncbi:MAG: class I SAM-dependent methyltransferase [Pseudomonadota bacterium]